MIHPWHDVPSGEGFPDVFPTVVEVPRKATTKYALNPELGILELDRITHPPIPYPANYGFIPQTLDEDGDPLDVLVAMQESLDPLVVVEVRPIGMVNLEDRGENDDKIICVHTGDPNYEHDVEVKGFEDPDAAQETLRMCHRLYRQRFPDDLPGSDLAREHQ